MLRLQKTVILLLITCLSSCNDLEFERCLIKTHDQVINCHDYEINKNNIGRKSPSVEKDIHLIDGGVCVSKEDWAHIYSTIKSAIDSK